MFAQFGLRDIDPRESGAKPGSKGYWANWQGGLFTADGQPKPAAQAFKQPFWAQVEPSPDNPNLSAVLLFGQVRGAKGPQIVHVERQDPGTGAWVPVSVVGQGCDEGIEFSTDATGGFLSACALRRQRELSHDRPPGGRQLRAGRRDPGQQVAAT